MAIVLPIGFIWLFEVARLLFIEPSVPIGQSHIIAPLLMTGAVVLFGIAMSTYFQRAQRHIVRQNKDLSATHAVSSAVRGGVVLSETVDLALERLVELTGALAGVVHVRPATSDGSALVVQRPGILPNGLDWLAPILAEGPASRDAPSVSRRPDLDLSLLDVPLRRGQEAVGSLRLAFHPAVDPDISDAALTDIAGELATAIELNRLVGDLQRREREQHALYEVGLQLTERTNLSETLDAITLDARELLAADRAVVCLTDPASIALRNGAHPDRLALADSDTVCLLAHPSSAGSHLEEPLCPLLPHEPGSTWTAKPLRGPDGLLGELCVARSEGGAFTAEERSLLGALADMAAIAVRTAKLHEAEEQKTILAERDRVARELHDSLAQVLGVIHLQLRAMETQARAMPTNGLAGELAELGDVADEAYRDVREAILGLRETISSEAGLEGALREYLHKYSRQTGIQTSLVCDGRVGDRLSPAAEVQLLRVVQEALTNVRKHSGASRAVVRIEADAEAPVITVEDDGSGFDPSRIGEALDHGFGMASMRERVEQVGGTLDVETAPGEGTRIIVRLQSEEPRVAHAAAPSRPAGR
jgi:signal transduction histidine kinase